MQNTVVRGAEISRSYADAIPPADKMLNGLENRSNKHRLDWRWKQAKDYSDQDKLGYKPNFSREDDALVVQYIKPYIYKYGPGPTKTDIEESFTGVVTEPELKALHWANKLRTSPESTTLRYMLEAFLCSEATIEEISEQLLIPPANIWWYRKSFLDVEGILDNPCRMTADLLFSSRNVIPKVEDFFWKAVAWKHGLGSAGLKQLVHPTFGLSPAALKLLRDIIEHKMATDTVQALHTRSINSYNENLVIDQFQRNIEISSKGGSEEGSGSSKEVGMLEFLGQFASHIGVAKHTTEFKGYEGLIGYEPEGNIFEQRRKAAAGLEGEKE
jgi:hypothetical protein